MRDLRYNTARGEKAKPKKDGRFMIKQYEDFESFEWTEGMGAFMERMNFKARIIGMKDSKFFNPYGGRAFGYNETTCSDILRLGLYACAYRNVLDVMSLKGTATIHVFGPNERDVDIEKDWQEEFDAAYVRVHGEGKCPFPVYAGKGGGWSGAGHKVYAFLGYARVEGKNVLGVVANVSADRSVGRLYRQNAFVELLEIVRDRLRGEPAEGMRVKYADYAAATVIPDVQTVFLKNRPLDLIFAQDPDARINPASMTKVLTAITVTDVCGNDREMYEIKDLDICNDSNYWAFPGDMESIEAGMYPVLVKSNGSNTLAMARHCGELILRERQLIGIPTK